MVRAPTSRSVRDPPYVTTSSGQISNARRVWRVPTTLLTALSDALARDPGRPLVTFYDGSTGERIELSVKTFDNWVSKVANLLGDELMLEPGDALSVDLPTHWQTTVVVVGAWAAGLHIVEAGRPSAVAVVGPTALDAPPDAARAVLAISLRPLGGAFAEPLPEGWLDFAREVPPQPDALLVTAAPRGEDLALVSEAGSLSHAELVETATKTAAELGLAAGGRLVTDANPARPDEIVAALAAPMAIGGSVVLVVNADADRRESIAAQEAATTSSWMTR
jgi:uncharacterized protein (TIGR03089 family)